ncbi:MAG: hypothetical protein RMJ51_01820 [Candidatus Calescibacterium sp.]|nr:hypothetical protein [Candidatus Calescibacterium sp.]MDW8194966.1 hypothetical protein [Candidatus Calescibacterium sp.]
MIHKKVFTRYSYPIMLFFYFLILLAFFLFSYFSEIRGSYEEFLEYRIRGDKIYSTLYLDKFYQKFLTKSQEYSSFSKTDYPSLYRYINSIQKKYIFSNFFAKLYINLIARNRVTIYASFVVKDRNYKLPFYLNYLNDSTVQIVVLFNGSQDINNMYLSLRNDYLDLYCEASSIAVKGVLKFNISFLQFQNLNIYDLSGKINFQSFPINTIDLIIHSKKISYLYKDITVFITGSKLSGSEDLVIYSEEITFMRKEKEVITIDGLSVKFKNLNWNSFLDLNLNLKADLLRIVLNREEVIFYSLDSECITRYLKNILFVSFDYVRWLESNVQRMIPRDFKSAELIHLFKKYEFFMPPLAKKIFRIFSSIQETTRNIGRLTITMDLSENDFVILYRDMLISFGEGGISFLGSGDLWLYFNYSGELWVLAEKEFGILNLTNKKAVYFSGFLGACISWSDKFSLFLTDYKNSIFWNNMIFGAKLNDIANIFSFLKLNRQSGIFKNFPLNFVPTELLVFGTYNPNELRILFSNKDICVFFEIGYKFRELANFESLTRRFIDMLARSNNIGFWDYRGLFGIFINDKVLIDSSDFLLYYKVDWEKLKSLYLLFVNHYREIRKDFYPFIVKNFDYFYDRILKGSQAFFYKRNGVLVFLDNQELLFNYMSLVARSSLPKQLVIIVEGYSSFFELCIDRNLLLSAYGFRKIYDRLIVEYEFKKVLSLEKFLKTLIDRRINVDLFLKESATQLFFDIDIYLEGKRILGFHSQKAGTEGLFVNANINLDWNELVLLNQILNLVDQIEVYKIQSIKINSLLRFSENGVQINLKDSKIYLGYLLNFFLVIDGSFDLKIKYSYPVRIGINSFNAFITCWSNDKSQWGKIEVDFSKDTIKAKLFLSNHFLDFINLGNILHLANTSKEDILKLEVSYKEGFLYGRLEVDCKLENLIFKEYNFKEIEAVGYVAFWNSVFGLDSQNVDSIDDLLSFLSKFHLESSWKLSYYSLIDDIYRKAVQDISFELDSDNLLLDGKIQVSLKEILRLLNLEVKNEYIKEYLNQIYSTGFIEIDFQNLKINNFSKFIKSLLESGLITLENKEIFSNVRVNLYFILFGNSYVLSLNPEFKLNNNHYVIHKLRFVLSEANRMIMEFIFDYATKKVDSIYLIGIPSFLLSYCEGDMNFSLDFKNRLFVFDFDRFSFMLLSNRIFLDGRMIFRDRGFVSPIVKVNNSPIVLGFDGNVITLISDLDELDLGSFYYKGSLKVNLVIFPFIREPGVYGNIECNYGKLEYRRLENKGILRIPINLSINFNSVRFRNNFIDVIFSGDIKYFSGILVGELRAKKGFVVLIDGLYKILQGIWSFDGLDTSGDLYVVLQKISSDIFDYKITIFKGDIKNLSLGEFGRRDNKEDFISDRLALSFFNTPILDLMYFSWQGYTIQREILPNVFISYFSFYSGNNRYSRVGYDWYYSIDWIIKRLGKGIISINFRTYSNARNQVSIIFVKGF